MGLMDDIVRVYNDPDLNPYQFEVGQTVRLLRSVTDDGQTHEKWAGAKCKVLHRYATGILKDHWYKVQHDNGSVSEFREGEIDSRYARKAK